MADAGIRLVVEGEREFKAALAACDTAIKNNQKELKLLTEEYKLNETGMKSATSGFGSMANAADILATKGKVLADSIAQQSEKVALLDQRVAEAAKEYGEHDKRTEALRAQLLDASAALAKLTAEQEKNRQATEDAKNSTKAYDDASAALTAALSANEAELKNMGGGMDSLKKEYDKLGTSSDDLAKKQDNLRQQNANLEKQNKTLSDSVEKQKKQIDTLNEAAKVIAQRYGEGSKEAEAYRKRIADATGQLDKMERELKENQTAIENNNKALEKGGDSGKSMKDVLGEISDLTGVKIPGGLEKMIGGMDAGTAAAGGILAVLVNVGKKVKEIYDETLEYSQEITTKASELDITTGQYQALEHAAKQAGISMTVFENALSKISVKASDAVSGTQEFNQKIEEQRQALSEQIAEQEKAVESAQKTAEETEEAYMKAIHNFNDAYAEYSALVTNPELVISATKPYLEAADEAEKAKNKADEALEKSNQELDGLIKKLEELENEQNTSMKYWDDLGISIYDANGKIKSSYDLMMELIDAYSEIPPGVERASQMTEIFGKQYKQLNPIIESGTYWLQKWIQEAYDLDIALDDSTVATNNYMKNQKDAWGNQLNKILQRAVSEFNQSSNAIEGAINAIIVALDGLDKMTKQIMNKSLLDVAWSTTPWGVFTGFSVGLLELLGITDKSKSSLSQGGKGKYATGTMYAPGGYSLVGERGPEIVELPRGSKVFPNGTVPAGFGGGETVYETNTYNVTIDASRVQEFEDIVRIAQSARVGMRRG